MAFDSTHELETCLLAGKYRLVRWLGKGAMGVVYEALHVGTQKRCAVKLLLSEFEDDPDRARRFLLEARAAGVLESDHIVKVFDAGTDSNRGCPYIVMEYLEGEDLAKVLRRLGPLRCVAALKIALQVAMGLAKAHAIDIVHRDIKPANLFLTRGDSGLMVVKILDFGVAKVKPETVGSHFAEASRSGSIAGTPLYMSPEQISMQVARIGPGTDVWSLGVVLWELLTGSAPFSTTDSPHAVLAERITGEQLPNLLDEAPSVWPEVADIVYRALDRDPERRYRNAGELRDALLHVVAGGPHLESSLMVSLPPAERRVAMLDSGVEPTRTLHSGEHQRPRPPTGPRRAPALLIGLAAITGGILALQLTSPNRTRTRLWPSVPAPHATQESPAIQAPPLTALPVPTGGVSKPPPTDLPHGVSGPNQKSKPLSNRPHERDSAARDAVHAEEAPHSQSPPASQDTTPTRANSDVNSGTDSTGLVRDTTEFDE
jgi:eukaryotic-like serine/threonine-protein kinase